MSRRINFIVIVITAVFIFVVCVILGVGVYSSFWVGWLFILGVFVGFFFWGFWFGECRFCD